MSYTPDPNSNIGKIFAAIPEDPISSSQLQKQIAEKHPDIRKDSIATHFKFLVNKKVINRKKIAGEYWYSKPGAIKKTLGDRILEYLKEFIGKKISTKQIQDHFGFLNTGYLDIIKRLERANVLQHTYGTGSAGNPKEYLVLPDIKALDQVPTNKQLEKTNSPSVIQKQEVQPKNEHDIAKMSIGDILTEYIELKQENQRLKDVLHRIGVEFINLGIFEGD